SSWNNLTAKTSNFFFEGLFCGLLRRPSVGGAPPGDGEPPEKPGAERARGEVGRPGWSADLPLAPLRSLLLGVLRGIAGEVMVTEKASSWGASAKYCSIGLSASPSWDSGAT